MADPHAGPHGAYRDILVGPDGGVVWQGAWTGNLIVDGLRSLLAALVKGDAQGAPVSYWAVGSGNAAWDGGTLPPETERRARIRLYQETARRPIPPGQVTFLGGSFTNRLEITAEFNTADLPADPAARSLREFGVFGGGSAATDSGVLINHRIHPRIDLQAGFTLQRTLRLTF